MTRLSELFTAEKEAKTIFSLNDPSVVQSGGGWGLGGVVLRTRDQQCCHSSDHGTLEVDRERKDLKPETCELSSETSGCMEWLRVVGSISTGHVHLHGTFLSLSSRRGGFSSPLATTTLRRETFHGQQVAASARGHHAHHDMCLTADFRNRLGNSGR